MKSYVVLLRGINVGGKNKIPMLDLRQCLEAHGFVSVTTYIQSGNVILRSELDAEAIGRKIETLIVENFALDSAMIRVLVLNHEELQAVIDNKPEGFGERSGEYYYDVIFLMGIKSSDAMAVFKPREGVDRVWPGEGVVYSERLGAERTKSRLNRIVGTPMYASMTIRNWATTIKLSQLLANI